MIDWIETNASVVNAASSVAMLAVWVVYLQIFRLGYRRQVRAKIVINRAVGTTLGAHCFISNMSSQSIYVEAVIVTLEWENRSASLSVTDLDHAGEDRPSDPRLETHQGPLHSGEQTWIGTFDELIGRVAGSRGEADRGFTQSGRTIMIEVTVIADYLSEDLLVGAKRRFRAEWKGEAWIVRPETVQTEQIRSRRKRREITRRLAEKGKDDAAS